MTPGVKAALVTPLLGVPAGFGWGLLTLVATNGLSDGRGGAVLRVVGITLVLIWLASPWLAWRLSRVALARGWANWSSFWAGTLGAMAVCGVVILAVTLAALADAVR
ncbi:hypothetical protein [Ottowia testudinis]|uniref:Uncharacterized protein n=1 Tax=Ottowia testudinis TaxID=2816950 RepID=A0A975H1T8_9BURK|nr:hypothetical protein [Ottowia testudinis]QTD44178.1 hypothetical protein J1M35_13710 [Ottowia testudinis]